MNDAPRGVPPISLYRDNPRSRFDPPLEQRAK